MASKWLLFLMLLNKGREVDATINKIDYSSNNRNWKMVQKVISTFENGIDTTGKKICKCG